jgi:hypothetical protein
VSHTPSVALEELRVIGVGSIWARLEVERELQLGRRSRRQPEELQERDALVVPEEDSIPSVTYSPPSQLDTVVNRLEAGSYV